MPSPSDSLPFIEILAESVCAENRPENGVVILPSQRAINRFRKQLAQRMSGPGWLPRICTLSDLLQDHAEQKPLDSLEAQALLFSTWSEIKSDEAAADMEGSGFLAFAPWGRMALRDFNEIDHHLLDASDVFQNLCAIEGIKDWSFRDPEKLKPGQVQFLEQWMQLKPLYLAFQLRLKAMKSGYPGSIARAAVDQPKLMPYDWVFAAGLSVLTPAEMAFLGRYEKHGALRWFWDADRSYVKDSVMEAGQFIRQQATPAAIDQLPNRLAESPPKVRIVACSSTVYQSQFVRQEIAGLSAEERNQTGVVLPNGSSLSMLLQSLPPADSGGYNVTMGLAWTETPAYAFLELIMRMVLRAGNSWNHADLRSLVSDPVSLAVGGREPLQKDGSHVFQQLARHQLVWLDQSKLAALSNGPLADLTASLMPLKTSAVGVFMSAFEAWSDWLDSTFESDSDPWVVASWLRAMRAISIVRRFQETHGLLQSPAEAWSMVRTSLMNERIDLLGEPDQGLQIMGLMETRALDFDRVIILDCNEGTLPQSVVPDSFFPFDLRAYFGLPGRHEREAIFAYYTYRLLNRAREVIFVYNAEDERAEKSRYILQLEQAFRPDGKSLLPLSRSAIRAPLPGKREEIPALTWSSATQQRLEEWSACGISPSALNTLMACKRNFFYQYMLRLNEPPEIQEEMAANTFGSIVHQVLEDGLKGLLNQPLKAEALHQLKTQVQGLLPAAIDKYYNSKLIETGENFLQVAMAEATLKKILAAEARELTKSTTRIIRSLELNLTHTYERNGTFKTIRLHGKADRIDLEQGDVVITDYKTGSVQQTELNLPSDWQAKIEAGKSGKALQLLVYAAIALEVLNTHGELSKTEGAPLNTLHAGIRSGRNARAGLLKLTIDKRTRIDRADAEALLDWIVEQLESLNNGSAHILHEPKSRYCSYCVSLDPVELPY